MPEYAVRLLDGNSKIYRRKLQAVNEAAMREAVRQQRMWIIGVPKELSREKASFDLKLPIDDLQSIIEQLAFMLDGGIGIQSAVERLATQYKSGPVRFFLTQIAARIAIDGDLSMAFGQFPRMFPKELAAMLKPAQETATVLPLLRKLAHQLKRQSSIRATVKKATTYPSIVLTMAIGIIILASVMLIPKIQDMINELAMKPPTFTRALFTVAYLVRSWSWAGAIAAVAAYYGLKRICKKPKIRRPIEAAALRIPKVGPMMEAMALANICSNVAMLYSGNMPIEMILERVASSTRMMTYSRALAAMLNSVKGGSSIAGAMQKAGVFPPMCCAMVATGEAVGEVPAMFDKLANYYAEKSEQAVARALTVLEPALIVALSMFVGWIIAAMVQPIFALYQGISSSMQ